MDQKRSFMVMGTYLMLFIILFTFIIIIAKNFLVPVSFGLLIGSLLFPVCKKICSIGIPKGISIFITILLMMGFLTGISIFFAGEIGKLTNDFPSLKVKALDNVNQVSVFIEETFGIQTTQQKVWLREQINDLFTSGSQMMNNLLNATAGTLFKILLMPVFVFYLLYYQERFRFFILRVTPQHERRRMDKILHEISFVSQRYVGGAFMVVVILSVLNSLGLYIIGLEYAILFGVISAFFNFIPYFGTWIGAFFPFTFALLTGDSPNLALWVLAFFAVIQFTENNILTPNITGGYVRLNPFITILGLIAGGMVWGVAGMLLVIPFLASLKIAFEKFESTKAIAYLLARPENEPYQKRVKKIQKLLKVKEEKPVSDYDN
jgi:predicted PurR-regulated permease PerM